MRKKELIALVRRFISDEQATGYTEGGNLEMPEGTQELTAYLDRAVETVSVQEAKAGNARFLKRMPVSDGAPLPKDFIAFAGNNPVSLLGGKMSFYGAASTLPVRYWAMLPYVSSFGENDALPYRHDDELRIAALAAIYALNKHEFNVSQDLMLLGMGGAEHAASE